MLTFDHIAVSAATLEEGVAWVESTLGVTMAGGGIHPLMSTHNRLLGLGDLYLEVIAIDPDAPKPSQPRWFDLDRFEGTPRLTNWVTRSDDLDADIAASPKGVGRPVSLSRGDFFWKMAVPANGVLPFHGCFPALIQWLTPIHPTQVLPESGVRLKTLTIRHPRAKALRAVLSLKDPRLQIAYGRTKSMTATFHTPLGDRSL